LLLLYRRFGFVFARRRLGGIVGLVRSHIITTVTVNTTTTTNTMTTIRFGSNNIAATVLLPVAMEPVSLPAAERFAQIHAQTRNESDRENRCRRIGAEAVARVVNCGDSESPGLKHQSRKCGG
jgi:hypothetical protein